MSISVPWSSKDIETMIRMRDEFGATASQIGDKLGRTRNSVCGMLNRLGLKKGVATPLTLPMRVRAEMLHPVVSSSPPLPPRNREHRRKHKLRDNDASAFNLDTYIDWINIMPKRGECCWPEGDPIQGPFSYCRSEISTGSYCAAHNSMSFKPRRDRSSNQSSQNMRAEQ